MNLEEGKAAFDRLLTSLKPEDVSEFLSYIHHSYTTENPIAESQNAEAEAGLLGIIQEIKTKLPVDGVFPSEVQTFPKAGLDSDCHPETTVHIDSFLFDDDDIDELEDMGVVSRRYCGKCGSHDTRPLTFISHSLSLPCVKYIFTQLLPPEMLKGKILLDVGSRLGAVLYGGYFYSPGLQKLIGIEINPDLVGLQSHIIQQFSLGNKIQVFLRGITGCTGKDRAYYTSNIVWRPWLDKISFDLLFSK